MSLFSWFFDWLEDIEDRHDWEESGKPYYIQDDDGKYKRVSAITYENHLLDKGYSPKSAREYMKDYAYNPDLPPPEVVSDDDPDRPDPPPAEFFDDPERPDPPPYDFFNDDEDADF